jgi:hypothetical protein
MTMTDLMARRNNNHINRGVRQCGQEVATILRCGLPEIRRREGVGKGGAWPPSPDSGRVPPTFLLDQRARLDLQRHAAEQAVGVNGGTGRLGDLVVRPEQAIKVVADGRRGAWTFEQLDVGGSRDVPDGTRPDGQIDVPGDALEDDQWVGVVADQVGLVTDALVQGPIQPDDVAQIDTPQGSLPGGKFGTCMNRMKPTALLASRSDCSQRRLIVARYSHGEPHVPSQWAAARSDRTHSRAAPGSSWGVAESADFQICYVQ